MMKRRRMNENGGDLADVNEQELAKDGSTERDIGDQDTAGTDIAQGESVPVCHESEKITDGEDEIKRDALPTLVDNVTEIVSCDDKNTDGGEDTQTAKDEPPMEESKAKTSQPVRKKKKRRGRGYIAIIVACFLASLALLVFAFVSNRHDTERETEQPQDTNVQIPQTDTVSAEVFGARGIYERYAASTVTVCAIKESDIVYASGFCAFEGGYLATLYETVADAESIEIILADGSVYPAGMVGGDQTVDLALLKVENITLESVRVGSSDGILTGSDVYAIGSIDEGRYGASLVSCEVSYAKRSPRLMGFDGYERRVGALQISGGLDDTMKGCPVFAESGDAVAILFSVSDGVSFALPLDRVVQVLSAIKDGQEPSIEVLYSLAYIPPRLGILGEQTEADGICGISIGGFDDENSDVAAKLRTGDIIFRINESLTPDTASLSEEIEKYKPGDSVEIYVYRNGQKLSFSVKLS